jgi:hypothetical protein
MRVGRDRKPSTDLKQQLERCKPELNEAREDLTEALEQQTATSEVLRVISNSRTDVQSVLRATAESAARLLDVTDVQIMRVEGDALRSVAKHGPLPNWMGLRPTNRPDVPIIMITAYGDAEYPIEGFAVAGLDHPRHVDVLRIGRPLRKIESTKVCSVVNLRDARAKGKDGGPTQAPTRAKRLL